MYVYKVQKKQALAVRPKVLLLSVNPPPQAKSLVWQGTLAVVDLQKIDCITKVWKFTNLSNRLDRLTNIKWAFEKGPFYNNK